MVEHAAALEFSRELPPCLFLLQTFYVSVALSVRISALVSVCLFISVPFLGAVRLYSSSDPHTRISPPSRGRPAFFHKKGTIKKKKAGTVPQGPI
jgi:hypothetical protein